MADPRDSSFVDSLTTFLSEYSRSFSVFNAAQAAGQTARVLEVKKVWDEALLRIEAGEEFIPVFKGKPEVVSPAAYALLEGGLSTGDPLGAIQAAIDFLRQQESGSSFGEKAPQNGNLLASFALNLAKLIQKGVSLYDSLKNLSKDPHYAAIAQDLTAVSEEMMSIGTLSGAIAKHPKLADPNLLRLIEKGEQEGALDSALVEFAKASA